MSQREEKISKLLEFPYDAFLMVRLEYVHILGDELEAKLLRIIEKYVEQARKNIYQKMLNTSGTPPPETVEIARDIWVPISYRLFMNDLFGTVTSENTVKKALKHMIDKRIIFHRFEPKKQYDAPEYKIHVNLLQMLLNLLKVAGYQTLIPSIFDTLKTLPPQELTPSECQKLIPSTENSSSDQNLRVSKFDTNIREGYDNNITSRTENSGAIAPSSSLPLEDEISEEDEAPTVRMPAIRLNGHIQQTPLEQTPGVSLQDDQAISAPFVVPEPVQVALPPAPVQATGKPEKPKRGRRQEAQLTLHEQEIKEWYEELRGVEISLSKRTLTALAALGKRKMSKDDFLSVTAILDSDKWFEEHRVGVDLYWINFHWENKIIFLQRKPATPPAKKPPGPNEPELGVSGLPKWKGPRPIYD